MKDITTLALALVFSVSAWAVEQPRMPTERQVFERMRPLPPKADRLIVGEWTLESDHGSYCTVSIVSGAGNVLLVQDCELSTGCCNGAAGLLLTEERPRAYRELAFDRLYEIQGDGTLLVREAAGAVSRLSATPREGSLSVGWK